MVQKLNHLVDMGLVEEPAEEPDSTKLFPAEVVLPTWTSYDTAWAEIEMGGDDAELARRTGGDKPD